MRAFRTWALLVSLAAHVMLLLLLLDWEEEGAREAGVGGIEVALGPAGSAPGSVAAVDVPLAETVEPLETARPVEAVEADPEKVPVAEAPETRPSRQARVVEPGPSPTLPPEEAERPVAEAPEETEPEPPLIGSPAGSETAPAPPEVAANAPPEVADAPPAEPAPAIEPRSITASGGAERPAPAAPAERASEPVVPEARMAEADTVSAREAPPPPAVPPPKPAPPPEDLRTTEAPAPLDSAPLAQAPSIPGTGGRSGADGPAEAGADSGGAGGGLPGSSADYLDLLRTWLERHKEYPRRAQLRRQEGTALLRFVVDRDGHVLSYRIEESSGHAALDDAVEEMLERAQPLPTMPPEMTQARLELVVPVTFQLR
jgi:periplasmic protein TonB